jgi:hypothetical protein
LIVRERAGGVGFCAGRGNVSRRTGPGMGILLLVDDHGHAGLAMLCLGAVDPHGRCGIDEDGVGRHAHVSRCNGNEARENACGIRVQAYRLAWIVKIGLRDGVVLGHELELHHVAFSSGDIVGRICEGAIRVADGYDVDSYLA